MTSLGTVISAMLAQLGRGRVQADFETVELAEIYKDNPSLKGFPVPRLTIDEVIVDLKLAIFESPVAKREFTPQIRQKILAEIGGLVSNLVTEASVGTALLNDFPGLESIWSSSVSTVNEEISSFLLLEGIEPDAVAKGVTAIILNHLTKAIFAHPDLVPPGYGWSIEIIRRFFEEYIPQIEKSLNSQIQRILRLQLEPLPFDPNRLNVLVTTTELGTISPEKITTMKFTLREADWDWTRMETPTGEMVNKLIPH